MDKFHERERTVLNVCGCGRLHLTYGLLTLHFEPAEFLLFAGEVAQLAAKLGRGPESYMPVLDLSHKAGSCH